MRYRKFIVENYRAVERAEIEVGNNLLPLIGVNESGKTTILQAILAFDRLSDSYGAGKHLDYKNKYHIGSRSCQVTAEVVIDQESDLDALSDRLRLTRGDPLMSQLTAAHKELTSIAIHRDLETRQYSVSGKGIEEQDTDRLASALYRRLPFILYFDDFTDRVPEVIDFIFKEGGKRPYKLRNSRLTEWHRILEEVFARATNSEHTIDSFVAMRDKDEQDSLRNDINDVLNQEIIGAWDELRATSSDLADDPASLELELRFVEKSKGFRFQFKVEDRAAKGRRVFNVTDRSKGFQWFFNFHMKLKFNPKYQQVQSGAIYLLDEPGSYLHSSAQTQLLRTLGQISNTNSILYCTHSQHLLDPDYINIARTRIVHKDGGTIRVVPFGSSGSNNHQGALTPLFQALHLRTGVFNRELKRVAVTEGVTDYYLIKMYIQNSGQKSLDGLDLIPGAGAPNLKDLISMCIAWAEDFRVLLDSDKAGLESRDRYAAFFGPEVANRIFTYRTTSLDSGVKLELLLSPADRERLEQQTGIRDTKAALADLYYGNDSSRKEFWSGLNQESHNNLSILTDVLAELCG